MTDLTRHERRKLDTRRRLLEAARQVIAARGYEATGVLDITEAADVSKGTFYLHFKDKEDLTRVLIHEGFEELRQRVDPYLTANRTLGQIKEAIRAVFHYSAENRDLFRLMLGHQASAELNLMAINYYAEFVEHLLRQEGTAGRTSALQSELVAQFVAGAGVRLGLWWIEDDHGLSPDEMADFLFQFLTEGMSNVISVAGLDTGTL